MLAETAAAAVAMLSQRLNLDTGNVLSFVVMRGVSQLKTKELMDGWMDE